MNKKQKYVVGIIAAVVLVILGLVLVDVLSNDTGDTSDADKEVTVVITTADEELANETVGASSDETLMDIMENHFDLDVTEEGFVEALEGVAEDPDEGLFWVFEVNDEMVTVGAEEFVPEDQDTVTWELMAF